MVYPDCSSRNVTKEESPILVNQNYFQNIFRCCIISWFILCLQTQRGKQYYSKDYHILTLTRFFPKLQICPDGLKIVFKFKLSRFGQLKENNKSILLHLISMLETVSPAIFTCDNSFFSFNAYYTWTFPVIRDGSQFCQYLSTVDPRIKYKDILKEIRSTLTGWVNALKANIRLKSQMSYVLFSSINMDSLFKAIKL